MNFAVIVFPGSNCDHDCHHAAGAVLGQPTSLVWHKDSDLGDAEVVIVPGGFSYGDYLRAGAISRFSPIMKAVAAHANAGRPVIGICNGFQILTEAGLLPGALHRNASLRFICEDVHVRCETPRTPFTRDIPAGETLRMPIAHGEGNYFCDPDTLAALEDNDQIVFKYCDSEGSLESTANPNGSLGHIAGVCNQGSNVVGLMPHPERASEAALGGDDGLRVFSSVLAGAVS
ncbi:MAG: phosphoribosylformylglycinamidine synthase subunit PurQ [Nitrospinota bacterium]|jgi:phosphoribosylformylglycinamidine synthase|nr:phosphoribosylformylglycinamidine synthase I [Nitrospinota bacterium]MDP6365668.1 phosphoribosylformylglycinamidine synthase subunit PurQ [Nitrospinota bacterium]MDP7370706.1 phosphoribosylformylglycinamidine synthase subunit PurQ [Nitrospinota bacterium]MDP7503840.1 phosphoribosylformylglycinamidine synthase subunit PurQ [Nitrospinota bacterium]MDP7662434.1 phosphoribosylformylglycinamidine synthase subunit PurQ [Nitrospinota bacterium]